MAGQSRNQSFGVRTQMIGPAGWGWVRRATSPARPRIAVCHRCGVRGWFFSRSRTGQSRPHVACGLPDAKFGLTQPHMKMPPARRQTIGPASMKPSPCPDSKVWAWLGWFWKPAPRKVGGRARIRDYSIAPCHRQPAVGEIGRSRRAGGGRARPPVHHRRDSRLTVCQTNRWASFLFSRRART